MGISWRGVALTVLALLVVAPLGVFAWQATMVDETPDRVRFSVDGVTWSADLEEAFFSSDALWEPGEVRTAMLWVRNDASVAADVTLSVICEAGGDLLASGALVVSGSVDEGEPQEFDPNTCANTVRLRTLEPEESATVTLRAELVGGIPGAHPVDSEGIRYRVTGSGRALQESSTSVLAATQARLVLAPVFLGLALVVTAVVMSSSRRQT